jgi:large subunit ribosomal protein L22
MPRKVADNQVSALARGIAMSPQKVRLVVDLVRGKKASEALALLRYTPKAAAEPVSKLIASAVANGVENKQFSEEDLVIQEIWVDGGRVGSWRRFAARGRFRPLDRKTCHIGVILQEKAE